MTAAAVTLLVVAVLVWPSGGQRRPTPDSAASPHGFGDPEAGAEEVGQRGGARAGGDLTGGDLTKGEQCHGDQGAGDQEPGDEAEEDHPRGFDDVADGVLLLALALRSGRGLIDCLELVGDIAPGLVRTDVRAVAAALRWGVAERDAWQLARPEWEPAVIAWLAATTAGIAPADLLEAAAIRIREQEEDRIAARVQRSAVLLVLPLGGLFLPGFIGTTVVPVVLSLLERGVR